MARNIQNSNEKKLHLIKGWLQWNKHPIPKKWITGGILSKRLKEVLKEKGVYILYKLKGKDNYVPFYVGISGFGKGKNLYYRLNNHAKGKKKNKWTHFTAFIMDVSLIRKRYLKDVEGVLIRILDPIGNKIQPRLEDKGYQKQIKNIIKEQVGKLNHKKRESELLFKSQLKIIKQRNRKKLSEELRKIKRQEKKLKKRLIYAKQKEQRHIRQHKKRFRKKKIMAMQQAKKIALKHKVEMREFEGLIGI
jgi:hypothetical protein